MTGEKGKVITARGVVEPAALGKVMMHEHLHCDFYNSERQEFVAEERPISQERRELLMREAVPFLKKCNENGCFAYVEATPPPHRAWPTFYVEASEAANMHIILCTGFYREVENGSYWVKKPEDSIWQFVVNTPVEALSEFCIREIMEGIQGTKVRAGAIKLASSQARMTATEAKAFRAGARAQKATGVHITTHCADIISQLHILNDEKVALDRVVLGHAESYLMDSKARKACIEWMRRGVNFLPTCMGIRETPECWRPLVEAVHDIFDAGFEDRVVLASHVSLAGFIHVEAECYLGQACTCQSDVRIGRGSLIGMGSVVLKDVPPNSVMVGNPARKLRDRTMED